MYEDPNLRLVKAEAILLETISKLVWIVSILYGTELILSFYDKEFTPWNQGDYSAIILGLIALAIIFRVLSLIDKHIMEYWKRKDT
jgi:hypothetical protein